MKRRFGVRARFFLVLATAGLIAALAQGAIFRPLVLSSIQYQVSQSVMTTARLLRTLVPTQASDWQPWVKKLSQEISGLFLIEGLPGSQTFQSACFKAGIDPHTALSAIVQGENITRTSEGKVAALVRIKSKDGERALLAIVAESAQGGSQVWSLWLWSLLLSLVLAGVGAYLVAYALVVRPIDRAMACARGSATLLGRRENLNDIEAIKSVMEAQVRTLKEANQRAERLAYEVRRMREDLKGAQTSLLRAEKLASVGQLAAGIAHEIGNPVGIIMGLSDLIKEGAVEGEEAKQFAGQISDAAQRIHNIIKDLLQFARPQKEEEASCEIKEVVHATVKLLKPQKRFKSIEVKTEFQEGPLLAEIKASQLQQVLVNLFLNAADAMQGKGTITVRAYKGAKDIFIEVEDEGPGIPIEERNRIFDPFYTTKAPGEGTGLGLPISAQIVSVYGGEITVEDGRSGKGACLRVRLWQAAGEM